MTSAARPTRARRSTPTPALLGRRHRAQHRRQHRPPAPEDGRRRLDRQSGAARPLRRRRLRRVARRLGRSFPQPRELDPWYDKVADQMAFRLSLRSTATATPRCSASGFARNGYRCAPLVRAQRDCHFEDGNCCIECLSGCRIDSKQSTPVTVLGAPAPPDRAGCRVRGAARRAMPPARPRSAAPAPAPPRATAARSSSSLPAPSATRAYCWPPDFEQAPAGARARTSTPIRSI